MGSRLLFVRSEDLSYFHSTAAARVLVCGSSHAHVRRGVLFLLAARVPRCDNFSFFTPNSFPSHEVDSDT